MKLICPLERSMCVPLRITKPSVSLNNGKLGGRPPKGIKPKHNRIPLKYFATIKISEEANLFVSLFVADFENLLSVRGKLNQAGLVEVIIHQPSERENSSEFCSQISEHDLQILPLRSDTQTVDGETIVFSGHKVGGYPYLIRERHNLKNEIDRLFEDRFQQIVQIDFPGNQDDTVSGDWFFGDGIFSLFGKDPLEEKDWHWYWDK